MPKILLNSREVTYLSDRDWRLKYLMRYMGDMDYQIDKSAFTNLGTPDISSDHPATLRDQAPLGSA